MKIERLHFFNFWIVIVFIYLFIKMEDILGISVVGSTTQLLLLYIIYGLGIMFTLVYGKHVVSRFLFLNILFVGFGIISTFLFGISSSSLIHDIVYMSFWLLVMFICYSCSDIITQSRFVVNLMVVFDLLMILSFYIWFLNGGRSSIAAVNAVYFTTCLFPIVFLDIKRFMKIIILVSSTACALLSGKRTALIVLVIAFALPYLCKLLMSDGKNKLKNIFSLVALSVLIVLLYDYLLDKFNITIFERFQNIAVDGGSGRFDIYHAVIEAFNNSGIINKVLGHGYNGVFNYGVTFTSAHNDFLEVLYDNGLIGLTLYLCFIGGVILTAIKLLKNRMETSFAVLSALMVFICMSITSHLVIYPTYFIYIVIIIMIGQSELVERNVHEGITY